MSSECELLFDINAETDLFIRCKTVRHLVPAGIEPATLSVWRTRDNHYTKEPCHWRGKYCRAHLDWEHQDEKGLVAQRITRLTTDQKIAGSNPAEIGILFNFLEEKTNCVWMKHKKKPIDTATLKQVMDCDKQKVWAPPGGLEPPTFRLTAERASRLRHGGRLLEAGSKRL